MTRIGKKTVRIREFFVGLALATFLAAGIAKLMPDSTPGYDVIMGLTLATLNGILATIINSRTHGLEHNAFMIWNIGGHGCRAALLLIAILCGPLYGITSMTTFTVVTFACYFSFLFFEISALSRHTNGTLSRT